MQETFLKAILSLSDKHTNMRAWLYRVARNLLFDYSKRHSFCGIDDEKGDDFACDEKDNPVNICLYNEKRRNLFRLISGLEKRKREVLMLQYYSGLSQKEIALMLHLSNENVRILSLRARRELKKKMEEDDYDFS